MKLLIKVILLITISLPCYSQTEYKIQVSGACGMCQDRIEETAKQISGVNKATYSLDDQLLTVDVLDDSFSIFSLHSALAEAGHDTSQEKADLANYDNLPLCCQYRPEAIKNNLIGYVYEKMDGKDPQTLIGANLSWLGSTDGTSTDLDGAFSIPMDPSTDQLIVSYVGFRNDTLTISKSGHVEIMLDPSVLLETVEIKYRRKSTEISYVSPIKIQQISSKELTKAACCSLSESFETTASVDVGFADAITGLRTIQMLGLAGPYVQITREGLPDVRGISSLYGMEYTPGPWIDAIQLNQGTGSVVSGYEGIAGQINVELYKPYSDEQIYINGYGNIGGRYEGNINYNTIVSDNVATALMLHGSTRSQVHDRNNDSFADMPLGDQFVMVNRWKFNFNDNWVGQAGVKITTLDHKGGQLPHGDDNGHQHVVDPWLTSIDIDRQEGWIKTGLLFNDSKSSLAIQLSASNHDHISSFGNRIYDAEQQTFYANVLFQQMIQDDGDYLIFGSSFTGDHVDEQLDDQVFDRFEEVPGVWAEYNFLKDDKWTIVPGIRLDHHNIYGWFTTPRLHLRYAHTENTVIRLAAGRGQKTASIIAENIGMLASNRSVIINSENNTDPYGLDAEVAWNYGVNLVQNLEIGNGEMSLQLDGYYTDFKNQIIVDYDADPRLVQFYNLDGKSTSISLQGLVGYSPHDRLDIKVAYRYNNVKADYQEGELEKPLIAAHRTFANASYESTNGWKFDYTINRIGSKRISNTSSSPQEFQRQERSPSFFLSNAQISKVWGDKFEIYLGGENIFDYRQENPITSADDTSSPYFDASQVWGPIFGRNFYVGLRHKLFNDN